MNFSGSDWALIITAATGFLGMLGTQVAQLMVSLKNSRRLNEANTKMEEAKVAAVETKAVIDNVKVQTDGLVSSAIAGAHAQGTAEGALAEHRELAAELKAAPATIPQATIAIDKAQVTIGSAETEKDKQT